MCLIKDDKILMIKRHNSGWKDGWWTPPAGHIEAEESASAAAARECFEEIGVVVEKDEIEHMITVHRHNTETGAVYFDNYFRARKWTGTPLVKEKEKEKASEIAWVSLNSRSRRIVPTVRAALAKNRRGKRFSEEGWKAGT